MSWSRPPPEDHHGCWRRLDASYIHPVPVLHWYRCRERREHCCPGSRDRQRSTTTPTPVYLHRQSLNKPAGKQHSLGVKQHQKQSLEVQHEQRLAQKHGELVRTWLWDTKLDLISQLRALIPSFLASLTMEAATLLPFALACRGKEKAVTDSAPSCTTQGISHSGASLPMSSGVG